MPDSSQIFSLSQLTFAVKQALSSAFPQKYYVTAEIFKLSFRPGSHAYFELVEKDPVDNTQIASVRATCWKTIFASLKSEFESVSGMPLSEGIMIQALVSVEFHSVYGLSLNIASIVPEYTVGKMQLQRKLTLQRLENNGLLDLNKGLVLPRLLKNIAVVSSKTAAGFGDFVNQLKNNQFRLGFNICLFEAVMQGNSAPQSITAALDRVDEHQDFFDCVVIIRGGGGKGDLLCFDDYDAAARVCTCQVPVIAGIGHDRDFSVVDAAACLSLKTPTAVAQYIIDCASNCLRSVDDCGLMIQDNLSKILNNRIVAVDQYQQSINQYIKTNFNDKSSKIELYKNIIKHAFKSIVLEKNDLLNRCAQNIYNNINDIYVEINHQLGKNEEVISKSDPKYILNKGYSFSTVNGKIIKNVESVKAGDIVDIEFVNGKAVSKIIKTEKK